MSTRKIYLIVVFIAMVTCCFAEEITIRNLESALKEAKKSKDDHKVINANIEIGDYYRDKKDFKKAEKYYNKSLDLSKDISDYSSNVTAQLRMAFLSVIKKEYDRALSRLNDALVMAKEHRLSESLIQEINQNIKEVTQKKINEEKYEKIKGLNQDEALQLLDHVEKVEQKNSEQQEENEKFLNKIKKLSVEKQFAAIELKLKEQEIASKEQELAGKKMQIDLLNKENELKKTEIAKREVIAQKQKIVITFAVTGLLLLVALTFFIYRSYQHKQKANELLVTKNIIIETKNKEITDSINYAKRIQEAMLSTSSELCKTILPNHFILYKPKDIVSGDFYWSYSPNKNCAIWVVADCTGHGVPGAFMNMIGSSLLNAIVVERGIIAANEILNELKTGIMKILGQTEETAETAGTAENGVTGETRDGMDAALCVWHKDTNKLEYAGAFNPLYIIRNNELIVLEADRKPVGWWVYSDVESQRLFSRQEIQLKKGDMLYSSSDGYMDQFGGEKGKKFSKKRFKDLLLSINDKTMEEQNNMLHETFEQWKGEEEQVDDICVIGVRV